MLRRLFSSYEVNMPSPMTMYPWYYTSESVGSFKTYKYTISKLDSKVGLKDPKWMEKVASLQDATHPYSRVMHPNLVYSNGNVDWVWIVDYAQFGPFGVRVRVWGDPLSRLCWSKIGYLPPSDPALISACKLDFLSKIRQEETPFLSGVFLGELKETIGMFKHPLKGILTKSKFHARRTRGLLRHVKNADRITEILGNGYLQWVYGVKPFLSDIEAIKDSFNKIFQKEEVIRVSASKKDERFESLMNAIQSYNRGITAALALVEGVSTTKVRITGALRANLTGPSFSDTRQAIGANLRDFVPTVYELLPYSFLIDYISTTGDVVNGFFTNTGNLVYASQSTSQERLAAGILIPLPYGTTPVFSVKSAPVNPAVRVLSKKSFNRVKADLSVSLRDFRFTIPSAGQVFNSTVLGLSKLRNL
jgi:hypothetical protein